MKGNTLRDRPYNKANITVGATALQSGDLCKIVAALVVPLAADDDDLTVIVATHDALVSAQVTCDVGKDWLKEIPYTGGTPTVGASYAVNGPRELDVTNTTNIVVTVWQVDTARAVALVGPYIITS